MGQRRASHLVWTGLIGSVVVSLCCTTPILVAALLGVLGLAGLIGSLDDLLLPLLVAFLGVTVYGLYRQRQLREQTRTRSGSRGRSGLVEYRQDMGGT